MSSYTLEELGGGPTAKPKDSYSLDELSGPSTPVEEVGPPSRLKNEVSMDDPDYYPGKRTIQHFKDITAPGSFDRALGMIKEDIQGLPKTAVAVGDMVGGLPARAIGVMSGVGSLMMGEGIDKAAERNRNAGQLAGEVLTPSGSISREFPEYGKELTQSRGYRFATDAPAAMSEHMKATGDVLGENGFPMAGAMLGTATDLASQAVLPAVMGKMMAPSAKPKAVPAKEAVPKAGDYKEVLPGITKPENTKPPVTPEEVVMREEQRAFEREQRKNFSTDADGVEMRVVPPPEILYANKHGIVAESVKEASDVVYYKERAERTSEVQRIEAEAAELASVGHEDIAGMFKERARELKRQQADADKRQVIRNKQSGMFVGELFGSGVFAEGIKKAGEKFKEGWTPEAIKAAFGMYLTADGRGAKAISDKNVTIQLGNLKDAGSVIPKSNSFWQSGKATDKATTLSSIAPNKYLYDGYKAHGLGDTPVVFTELPDGVWGEAHPDHIRINKKTFDLDYLGKIPEGNPGRKYIMGMLKQLIVHETQHKVQAIENWPRGGNKELFPRYQKYIMRLHEAFRDALLLKALSERFPHETPESIRNRWETHPGIGQHPYPVVYATLMKYMNSGTLDKLNTLYKKAADRNFEVTEGKIYYLNLAGEIQARLAGFMVEQSQAWLDSPAVLFDISQFEKAETHTSSPIVRYGDNSSGELSMPVTSSRVDFHENIVKSLLFKSDTLKEFQLRLELANKDAGWQEHVVGRALQFWEAKEALMSNWIPNAYTGAKGMLFGSMEPVTTTVKRNIFAKNTDGTLKLNAKGEPIVENLRPNEDISWAHRSLQGSDNLFAQLRGRAGEIFRSVISNTEMIVAESVKLFGEFKDGLETYGKLVRPERRKLIETMAKYDGLNNTYLTDKGLQWLDRAKLVEEGLNDKQISAYEHITRILDRAYDVINIAREKQGLEPIKKIPGYFPHTWHGRFKVRIYGDDGLMIGMKAFSNRWIAEKFVKMAEEEGLKTADQDGIKILEPSSKYRPIDFVDAMNQALEVTNSRSKLDAVIRKRLASLENRQLQGFFKSELENANVQGFTKKFDKSIFGDSFKNMDLENIYTHYFEGVANYYKDVMLRKDVLAPVEKAAAIGNFKHTPNLREGMIEYIARNSESTRTWGAAKFADNVTAAPVNAALARTIGVPGSVMGGVARGLMDYLYLTRLFLRAGYTISQFVQPLFVTNQLMSAWAKLGDTPNKGGFTRAFSTFAEYYGKQDPNFQGKNQFVNEGIKWMQENGKLDVENATHVDPEVGVNLHNEGKRDNVFKQTWKDTRGSVGKPVKYSAELVKYGYERLEENNRRAVAATFLAYFEKTVPGDRFAAYTAAVREMDLVMGNYTKGHSAGVYQHGGWIGRNSKPFSTLRNMYYGNAYETLKFTADQAKAKGVLSPEAAKAFNAFLVMQVTYGLMAGLQGLVFYKEAEWAYEKLREWNPNNDWMPFAYYHRQFTDWMGDAAYGVLGMATHSDIGTSVGAPSATEGVLLPSVGVATDMGALAWTGIKEVFADLPPPQEDYYKHWRKLAPNTPLLNPVVNMGRKIAPEHPVLGGVMQLSTVQGTERYYGKGNVVPYPQRLEGMVERTPAQDRTYSLWGSQDIEEKKDRTDIYVSRAQKAMDSQARASTVKKVADAMLGLTDVDPGDAIVKAMEQGKVGAKKDFEKAIVRELRERGLPQIQKDLARISQTNPQRAQRAYKLMEQMGAFKE